MRNLIVGRPVMAGGWKESMTVKDKATLVPSRPRVGFERLLERDVRHRELFLVGCLRVRFPRRARHSSLGAAPSRARVRSRLGR